MGCTSVTKTHTYEIKWNFMKVPANIGIDGCIVMLQDHLPEYNRVAAVGDAVAILVSAEEI